MKGKVKGKIEIELLCDRNVCLVMHILIRPLIKLEIGHWMIFASKQSSVGSRKFSVQL